MAVASGGVQTVAGRAHVEIVLHPIPSADAKPYIIVVGPDRHLWFCESGTAKIGRLDPDTAAFTEFATPTADSRPIGIIPGPDGNLWFCENAANQIGRITPQGAIVEFALPTPGAGPDGIMCGPDGNLWFSEAHLSRIGRITPRGEVTEFSQGPHARLPAAVDRGARWRPLVQRIRGGPDRPHHDDGRGDRIQNPDAELRAARHGDASGRQYLVRPDQGERPRPHRPARQGHGISGAHARRVAARRHGRARRRSVVHGKFRQQDRPHGAGRTADRRISDPGRQLRGARHRGAPDGRLFFSAHDAGAIGEVVPKKTEDGAKRREKSDG